LYSTGGVHYVNPASMG